VRRRQVFRVPQGLRSQVTGSSGGSFFMMASALMDDGQTLGGIEFANGPRIDPR
jgi:hypothetical protein